MESDICLVCFEDCDTKLDCNHYYHDSCLICFEDCNTKLDCWHYYHNSCLKEYIINTNNIYCTYCFSNFSNNDLLICNKFLYIYVYSKILEYYNFILLEKCLIINGVIVLFKLIIHYFYREDIYNLIYLINLNFETIILFIMHINTILFIVCNILYLVNKKQIL